MGISLHGNKQTKLLMHCSFIVCACFMYTEVTFLNDTVINEFMKVEYF